MSVEVNNESGVEIDEGLIVSLAGHVLERMGINPLAELSILVVDEETMSALHERWMGEPGPTDVLAFPMDELRPGPGAGARQEGDSPTDPALLGDVVLCPQVAAKQGAEAGHGTEAELELLCTHGILHLLGYDHAEPEEHKEMFGLQGELLESWQEVRPQR
ncbi:rRNA maturation RNase YbeY [Streptosporangium amethystogenes]|uniref:rRNA maturation RNase YbeY n=1 Tax=Streptosporangium amethystogenes TaxID=2002 RepID=UPI0004CC7382|nr:rRNA maturation RNase YbeY [Streptosporangium amethystogenes]